MACIIAGKNRGATESKIAPIIVPLITLPNNRTARAKVLEKRPMILKGSMIGVGSR